MVDQIGTTRFQACCSHVGCGRGFECLQRNLGCVLTSLSVERNGRTLTLFKGQITMPEVLMNALMSHEPLLTTG
jgi:hypothetical protein